MAISARSELTFTLSLQIGRLGDEMQGCGVAAHGGGDESAIEGRQLPFPRARQSQQVAVRDLASGQITDSYLLALACAREGKLATFDRRLVTTAVSGDAAALHL